VRLLGRRGSRACKKLASVSVATDPSNVRRYSCDIFAIYISACHDTCRLAIRDTELQKSRLTASAY